MANQVPLNSNVAFEDGSLYIVDSNDNTKVAVFECGTIATGTTRTFTFPNNSGTLALGSGSGTVLDDIGTGDAYSLLQTTSGNIDLYASAGGVSVIATGGGISIEATNATEVDAIAINAVAGGISMNSGTDIAIDAVGTIGIDAIGLMTLDSTGAGVEITAGTQTIIDGTTAGVIIRRAGANHIDATVPNQTTLGSTSQHTIYTSSSAHTLVLDSGNGTGAGGVILQHNNTNNVTTGLNQTTFGPGTGNHTINAGTTNGTLTIAGGTASGTVIINHSGAANITTAANAMTLGTATNNYTIQSSATAELLLTGATGVQMQSTTGDVTIKTSNGTSAVQMQNYTEYFGVSTTTQGTDNVILWCNDYLDRDAGLSGAYLVKANIAAVCGLSELAAGYEITNMFYGDANNALGLTNTINGTTYNGTKSHYGAAGGADDIGSVANMTLTAAGTSVELKMTPNGSNLILWRGMVTVIKSQMPA